MKTEKKLSACRHSNYEALSRHCFTEKGSFPGDKKEVRLVCLFEIGGNILLRTQGDQYVLPSIVVNSGAFPEAARRIECAVFNTDEFIRSRPSKKLPKICGQYLGEDGVYTVLLAMSAAHEIKSGGHLVSRSLLSTYLDQFHSDLVVEALDWGGSQMPQEKVLQAA